MTIEEIETLIQGYLEPNGVDSDDFLRGRSEGHSDIACALTKALDCESEKLNLTGLLRRARSLRDATFQQFQELMLLSRRTENEPHPMDAMPILLAYANGIVSQGRARELLLLWLRGAGAEELDSLIPKDDQQSEVERLREKLEKIENLSKHAWEQVDKNPNEARELFRAIYAKSK
jgi:hypothetical protein